MAKPTVPVRPHWDANSGNTAANFGGVVIYHRVGTSWVEEAKVRQPNPQVGDFFGYALALDADTLAVVHSSETRPAHVF